MKLSARKYCFQYNVIFFIDDRGHNMDIPMKCNNKQLLIFPFWMFKYSNVFIPQDFVCDLLK